jgi:hypothetical protein
MGNTHEKAEKIWRKVQELVDKETETEAIALRLGKSLQYIRNIKAQLKNPESKIHKYVFQSSK